MKKALGGASDDASQVQRLAPSEAPPVQMEGSRGFQIRMPGPEAAALAPTTSRAAASRNTSWDISGGGMQATTNVGYEPRAGGGAAGRASSPWANVRTPDDVIAMAAAAAGRGNAEGQMDWIDEQKASGSIPPDKRYLAIEAAKLINKRR